MKGREVKAKYLILLLIAFVTIGCEKKQENKLEGVTFKESESPEVWPIVKHYLQWERARSGLVTCVMYSYTIYGGEIIKVFHVIEDPNNKESIGWAKENAVDGIEKFIEEVEKHSKTAKLR